ncbi:MAG TPA: LacI family DNA-binding transcriptional regulator [Candidatus Eisenbergiella pullistercoris]|uniref:LacI family DNA-binding transcriptional regulator n=1 Tax=Candidatus Eisenbergiella pullistercoris TaxID=2838555 RepID=A0A9D1YPH2_9FIRM|nr:LacI family DNA-binding transcriptional regulator [Candidatus Eisenbergiella pullistercoris]
MATLKDVARETGLTVSTVSRVLNNRGYISKEAREKVYEAMKKLNYQPNEVARSLSKQTTNTIGVILPHIDHPYFSRLLSSLETAAYLNEYKLMVFNSNDRDDKEVRYLEMCRGIRVAGIILCSGTVDVGRFEDLGVPLVTIERFLESGTAAIECDNRQGGRMVAKHLAQKGCRTVVYLSGENAEPMPADERALGFTEICRQEGLTCLDLEEEKTDALYASLDYHEYIEKILDDHPEIDGIFASSDVIAAQVIQICRKKGIQIPDQIKLVGFDDSLISMLTSPAITTIRQPIPEMASLAVQTILRASNKEMVPSRTILPVSLVERETT